MFLPLLVEVDTEASIDDHQAKNRKRPSEEEWDQNLPYCVPGVIKGSSKKDYGKETGIKYWLITWGERRWEPRYCFASALQEAMPSAAVSPAQSQRLALRSSTQTPSGGSCLERLPNPSGAFQLSQSIGKQLPTCNSPLQLAGVGPVFLTGSWMT